MANPSELLFIQGNFKKLRSLLEARPKVKPDPYMLGALVFTGRTEDAEVYLEKWTSHYSSDEMALNLFFVAVGQRRSRLHPNASARKSKTIRIRRFVFNSRCATTQLSTLYGGSLSKTLRTEFSFAPTSSSMTPIPAPSLTISQ